MDLIEDTLYHRSYPPRIRDKPMEVMALGLGRSGTDSLRNALLQLGYDHTYHGYDMSGSTDTEAWVRLARRKYGIGAHARAALRMSEGGARITAEDFDAIIGHCVAVTDMPCIVFSTELLAAYPDAKIILNTRKDLDAWYRSMVATFSAHRQQPFRRLKSYFSGDLYWLYWVFEELFDPFFYGSMESNGKWVYNEHVSKIRGMVPKERLLEWSVEDGWEPLCEFLGKPTDNLPEFPSGNPPAEFAVKTGRIFMQYEARAKRNMIILGGVVAALIGILAWAFRKAAPW